MRPTRRRPVRTPVPCNILEKEHAEGEQDLLKEEFQPKVKSMELNQDVSKNLPKKRKRRNIKGGRRYVVPNKRRRKETSGSVKDGTTNMASKRPGSIKMESRLNKRRKVEAMGDTDDERPSMSPKIDMKQSSEEPGTKSSETPIVVTGLESFTFHRLLGEGGYGKVMLATHPACQQQLAVKMVKKRVLLQDFKENVLIERQVLEVTRTSPFFTHVYATFQTQDYLFFIMEYLSGGDLFDLMRFNTPFSIPVIRFFAAEIICGLQFLHARGIIHRDIKPENILLDSAGHVKIADFGLSVMNIFGDKKISEYAGTLRYMAPEILQRKPYNTSVDWFSAGVMLFKMATGKYPYYAGTDRKKIKNSLINDDPAYPEGLNPHVRDILERLLNKSPESRQTAVDNIRDHPFFTEVNWTLVEGARTHSPFQLGPPPAIGPTKMDNVLSSGEANKPPMSQKDKKLFCGFTFAKDGWQVVTPIQEPTIQHHRTFGKFVRETFHRIWKKIKPWK